VSGCRSRAGLCKTHRRYYMDCATFSALWKRARGRCEDEATAKAALEPEWSGDRTAGIWHPDGDGCCIRDESGEYMAERGLTEDVTAHIARHDPARVLREVAAKRAILAECEPRPGIGIVAIELAAQRILRHLAAVWNDHPDYRPEWKP